MTEEYENVECKRCGHQWYSQKFDEENKVPSNCPKCYQDEVRKIPEPPTKVEKVQQNIVEKKEELPEKARQKKHDLIIWKENNRFLLSMIKMLLLLLVLVGGVIYMLFLR
jgi:NAD-dependent SIR2 family protein deacetylase